MSFKKACAAFFRKPGVHGSDAEMRATGRIGFLKRDSLRDFASLELSREIRLTRQDQTQRKRNGNVGQASRLSLWRARSAALQRSRNN